MEIRIESGRQGAACAVGTVVIIDVFRAFTTAAFAFQRGARRIVMVDGVATATDLRQQSVGAFCMGEVNGYMPAAFDFPNSPAVLAEANIAGETLIHATTNGTVGLTAAGRADRLFAGALVTAEATVQAILDGRPNVVSLVAMGRGNGARAVEDELCALHMRSRLEGRRPDVAALRTAIHGMAPPPNPALLATGDYRPQDREMALDVDRLALAIEIDHAGGLLVAEPRWRDGVPGQSGTP